MTHSWHVGVVKAHIHQNGDPYNDRHSAIPKENSYHCTANQVTCGRRHILDYSSDPPVSHFALEEVYKKFRRLILLRNWRIEIFLCFFRHVYFWLTFILRSVRGQSPLMWRTGRLRRPKSCDICFCQFFQWVQNDCNEMSKRAHQTIVHSWIKLEKGLNLLIYITVNDLTEQ